MHADALGDPYRADAGSLGNVHRPISRAGKAGLAPWEYTIAKLLSDAGYATALYGKWHLGNVQGRLPNDQGYDEWCGIMNSWDEAGYTAWSLFPETGVPVPMIWEGKKGEESKPVMPLDLNVRPIVDEKYIIPKTIEYIKRNAAAKKPFFVYVGYSEWHMPVMANPNFVNKSPERMGSYADIIGVSPLGERSYISLSLSLLFASGFSHLPICNLRLCLSFLRLVASL